MTNYVGNPGDDNFAGTSGDDLFDYGNVTYSGSTITAAQGFDTISAGGGGNDTLRFSNLTSADYLYGRREGNDFVLYLQPDTGWSTGSTTAGLGGVRMAGFFAADGSGVIDRVEGVGWHVQLAFEAGVFKAWIYENDVLVGASQDGSALADNLQGSAVADELFGNGGDDQIFGYDGNDRLDGGAGNDNLQGGNGNDAIYGGSGNDFIVGGSGLDYYDGGADNDVVLFEDAPGGVTIDLQAASNQVANDGFGNVEQMVGVENLHGSWHDDTIRLSNVSSYVFGRAGNDRLTGGAGNDNLIGGSGADTLDGGLGNFDNASYQDDGFDSAGAPTQGAVVNLAAGTATDNWGFADTLVSIENLTGSSLGDTFTGNALANTLAGRGGADFLYGGDGNDTLLGANSGSGVNVAGDGADILHGEGGDDLLRGNAGDDQLFGGEGNDNLRGDGGSDLHDGGNGIDLVSFRFDEITGLSAGVAFDASSIGGAVTDLFIADGLGGIDRLISIERVALTGTAFADDFIGSQGDDQLDGNSGDDVLRGGNGSDLLRGFGDNDDLYGEAGDDMLEGGGGNDDLYGGTGSDRLIGGAGDDWLDGGTITDPFNVVDGNIADYSGSTAGINVNLQANVASSDGLGGSDTLLNIYRVNGSAQADTIIGSSGRWFEVIEGGLGDDILDGGAITDTYYVLDGNRVVYGPITGSVTVDFDLSDGVGLTPSGATNARATGAGGNDTLSNFNQVRGGSGNDFLYGSSRTDVAELFDGNAGDDLIDGRGGFDYARYDDATGPVTVDLAITGAQNTLGAGTDTLVNIEGLRGSSFGDQLYGSDTTAREAFRGQGGNDLIDGRGGFDRVEYLNAATGVTVTLGGSGAGTAADGNGGTDTLLNIEGVRGSLFDDTLTGSDAGNEEFDGRQGNDSIDGGAGSGDIAIFGGNRSDYLVAHNADGSLTLADQRVGVFNEGTDTVRNVEVFRFLDGDFSLNSAPVVSGLVVGSNSLSFTASDADGDALTLALPFAPAFGNPLLANGSPSTITPSAEANVLQGTLQVVDGFGGSADVTALAIGTVFNNTLTATVGVNSVIFGMAGNDTLNGSTGNDALSGGDGNDFVRGDAGSDLLFGGDGNDTLYGASFASSVDQAGDAADILYGEGGNDILRGNVGDDQLFGGDGDDNLRGDAGNDILDGGDGYDFASYFGFDGVGVTFNLSWITSAQSAILVTDGRGGTDTVSGIEKFGLGGTAGNDTLLGSQIDDQLGGGLGDDLMRGNAGSDNYVYQRVNGVDDGFDTIINDDDTGAGFDVLGFGGLSLDHLYGYRSNETDFVIDVQATTNWTQPLPEDAVGRVTVQGLLTADAGSHLDRIEASDGYALIDWQAAAQVLHFTIYSNAGTPLDDSDDTAVGHSFFGVGGANFLLGTVGDDTLDGGAGDDTLDGGEGSDTAQFSGNLTDYVITDNGDGTLTIADQRDGAVNDGIDTLSNVETAQFADQIVALNSSPTGSPTVTLAAGFEDQPYQIDAANLLAGFSDANGDTLSIEGLSSSLGTVTELGDGLWVFQPNPDVNGLVTLSYTVTDGRGGSIAATQTFTLAPLNDAPTGTPSAVLLGSEDTPLAITAAQLLEGFGDVDGDTLSIADLSATNGTVTADGEGSWSFAPTANFNGNADLSYTVVDGQGGSVAASLSVAVAAVNDAPAGTATAALSVAEDGSLVLTAAVLLQGFGDADGDALSIANLVADSGLLSHNGNGSWTFTPGADFNGSVALGYEVIDGNGGTVVAQQTITVNAVNDAPTVGAFSVAGNAIAFTAADIDSSTFTLATPFAAAFGNPSSDTSGGFSLTATAQASALSGTLTVSDGAGGTAAVVGLFLGTSGNNSAVAPLATLANLMFGFDGNDSLSGGSAADWITAGAGRDTVAGGAGDDTIQIAAGDFVSGESLDGGAGSGDTLALFGVSSLDLSIGTLAGIEALRGDGGSETVTLSLAQWAGFTSIDLQGGSNTLNVLASGSLSAGAGPSMSGVGASSLVGTSGNDSVTLGGAQLDAIVSGSGAIAFGAGNSDVLNLVSQSADLDTLGQSSDAGLRDLETISAAGATAGVTIRLTAQTEAFTLTGSASADALAGGSGVDRINGGAGADRIAGGGSSDQLAGGAGGDTIFGGVGNDALYGGGDTRNTAADTAADTFVFNTPLGATTNVDTIYGFEANGLDRIFLDGSVGSAFRGSGSSGIGSNFTSSEFVANAGGNATTTGQRILYDTSTGTLYYDADGLGGTAKVAFAVIDTRSLVGSIDFSDFSYGTPPPGP